MFSNNDKPLYDISFDKNYIIDQRDLKHDVNTKKYNTNATNAETRLEVISEKIMNTSGKEISNADMSNQHFQSEYSCLNDMDQEINSDDEDIEYDPCNSDYRNPSSITKDTNINSELTVKYFQYQTTGYGLKKNPESSFDQTRKPGLFHFTIRNSNLLNKSLTLLESNLYETKIDIKSLTYTEKQFDCFKVSYFKANYEYQDRVINFSAAIIPKNTKKSKDYLIEIHRQNNLNIDMFIKPIQYYYDDKFQFVLYPFLKRKIIQQEKSNKSVLRHIKDIASFLKQQHTNKLAFRSQTTDNLFVYNSKIKFLRSTNMISTVNLTKQIISRTSTYQIIEPIEFNPPEIFDKGWCCDKADIWCLGNIMFKLCNNVSPYNSSNYDFNIHIKSYYMAKFHQHIPVELQIVIRAMLDFDPTNRPSIHEVLLFNWFKQQMNEERAKEIKIEQIAKEKIESEKKKSSWFNFSGIKKLGDALTSNICSTKLIDFGGIKRSLSRSLSNTKEFLTRNVSEPTIKSVKQIALCNYKEEDSTLKFTPIEKKREQLIQKLKEVEKRKAKERREQIDNIIPNSRQTRKERKYESDRNIEFYDGDKEHQNLGQIMTQKKNRKRSDEDKADTPRLDTIPSARLDTIPSPRPQTIPSFSNPNQTDR